MSQSSDYAKALIEAEIHRPLALVTHASYTDWTSCDGELRLPFRPVQQVNSIVYAGTTDVVSSSTWVLAGSTITGLPRGTRVTVDYDHGWDDGDIPAEITVVQTALEGRVSANPDGLRSETIGGYSASFDNGTRGTAAVALTEGEREILRKYDCWGRLGTIRGARW